MTPRKPVATTEQRPHRIVRLGNDTWQNARRAIDRCCFCSFKSKEFSDWDDWAHTLILEPRVYKNGCVAIMSECPECFESSWVHCETRWLHPNLPEDWQEAIKKRHIELTIAAAREWAKGLCGNCKWLTKVSIDTQAWRHCKVGSGPSLTECEKFKPLATAKRKAAKP